MFGLGEREMAENSKLNILLCDDEEVYLNDLLEKVKGYLQTRRIEAEITATLHAESVLQWEAPYDIALLDIQMQTIDGIAFAKALRQHNERIIIFFVTAFSEYQDDVMDFQAFRFFEKPVNPERLYAGLDKALQYLNLLFVDVYVKTDSCVKKLHMDDIILVKTAGREISVVTEQETYTLWDTLEEWAIKLNAPYFYRIHKSYLVNLHHVRQYSYKEITMSDGECVPIPTRKQSSFHQVWFDYLRGKV